jgi:hypothetical protein
VRRDLVAKEGGRIIRQSAAEPLRIATNSLVREGETDIEGEPVDIGCENRVHTVDPTPKGA